MIDQLAAEQLPMRPKQRYRVVPAAGEEEEVLVVKCPAVGLRTLYGVASQYDTTWAPQLEPLLRPEEAVGILERANDVIHG